ncbi:TPA: hypothetical protein DDW69_00110 [candidate division CPR2 bacterium]|uniref:Uncharacterized protein n=1 Tax=candidate division CPR2 bacterium GW2011_GWC1_41_48 TaxID=1618344 RepID=A0A0G0W6Y7_UNCC2|nr:MAG: hypothetical protein UT47_C0005G0045 [candidate division CPR2 bacterium GW2011_GWC2_39_35]KKR28471.1 MAG: hypothetical protein UT60_C0019G0006 [candidate division CPR2 bacterium GW2011_GWD2_39_7]KKR29463.1 MAG: hypothetical protein UT59_C0007G0017 [candidate division CPR2 bacterium GW2011_GWD1_39_7]KKS08734.1 MAG: hypothetical protein UU65_C0005G0045 [candidate division CPR2 bacterium GW2011_GWC1_41_48]OGB55621.1 MAG: hypothetical protein A2Y27_03240 [candidate division CPR2 bacterium G
MDKLEKFFVKNRDERAIYYDGLASQAAVFAMTLVAGIFIFYYGYKALMNSNDTVSYLIQSTVVWIAMTGLFTRTLLQLRWKAVYKKDIASKNKEKK